MVEVTAMNNEKSDKLTFVMEQLSQEMSESGRLDVHGQASWTDLSLDLRHPRPCQISRLQGHIPLLKRTEIN